MKISVLGAEINIADIKELSDKEKKIFIKWSEQDDTPFKYGRKAAIGLIKNALKQAIKMHNNEKAINFFNEKNFKFVTQEEGRSATYYFDDGIQTGRLRQQHLKGPLAKIDSKKKERRSFKSKAERRQGIKNYESADCKHKAEIIERWEEPSEGSYLLEFNIDGACLTNCHSSGGRISKKLKPSDEDIKAIYFKIIGK